MERVGRTDGVRMVSAFECMGCGREKIDMDGGGQISGRKDCELLDGAIMDCVMD